MVGLPSSSEKPAKSSKQASTTRRGCSCADPWLQVGTGKTYSGSCAYRDPNGGPWTAQHTGEPGFCLVAPGSCKDDDELLGGDVWDSCEAAEKTEPKADKSKQMCATLLDACNGGSLVILSPLMVCCQCHQYVPLR